MSDCRECSDDCAVGIATENEGSAEVERLIDELLTCDSLECGW
ncbi:MAG: hypothetical protein RBU21_07930 [FCB group bacterium]|jgi:hypothetical protein|nr:hypothetical protein [FCB group bacterium]